MFTRCVDAAAATIRRGETLIFGTRFRKVRKVEMTDEGMVIIYFQKGGASRFFADETVSVAL